MLRFDDRPVLFKRGNDDFNALRQARSPGAKWVFANKAGKPYSRQNLQERVLDPLQVSADVVDAHGRAKYSFHAFRHSAASLFIGLGWSPKRVQTVLGHASIKMTFDRYGHLFADPEAELETQMASIELHAFAKVVASLEVDQKQRGVPMIFAMVRGAFNGKNWNSDQ